jgi:hypothetical protein
MSNALVHMEFWEGDVGKINVKGLSVLKFRKIPNKCDFTNGHCRSGFLKIKIYSLKRSIKTQFSIETRT